jgi:hypothetical protein
MSKVTRDRFTPKAFLGITAIVAGVLLMLRNLGVPGMRNVLELWPLVLVACGVGMLVRRRGVPGRGAGLLLIVVGAWMTLRRLGIVEVGIWSLWPLLLVFAGSYIVWQVAFGSGRAGAANDPEAWINAVAVLGGVTRRSASQNFKGGDLTAIMGGCEVDLSGAKIGAEGAVIETFAWWGGIEIRVPQEWDVVSEGLPLLGAYVDRRVSSAASGGTQRLTIRGMVIMGGIEIKN